MVGSVVTLSLGGRFWLVGRGVGGWSSKGSSPAVVFLFRFFRSSVAVVAGPLVAATLATVVDFVEVSLLEGGACMRSTVSTGGFRRVESGGGSVSWVLV